MGRRPERRPGGALGGLAALLGASVLTSCILRSQAQVDSIIINIGVQPEEPFVGGSVLLMPEGDPHFLFCIWHRGDIKEGHWILYYYPNPKPRQDNGPSYSGREKGGPKCTLFIKNLTPEDSGLYTIKKQGARYVSETGGVTIKVKVSAHHGSEKRLIAPIVVGALVGAVLVGLLLYCLFCL